MNILKKFLKLLLITLIAGGLTARLYTYETQQLNARRTGSLILSAKHMVQQVESLLAYAKDKKEIEPLAWSVRLLNIGDDNRPAQIRMLRIDPSTTGPEKHQFDPLDGEFLYTKIIDPFKKEAVQVQIRSGYEGFLGSRSPLMNRVWLALVFLSLLLAQFPIIFRGQTKNSQENKKSETAHSGSTQSNPSETVAIVVPQVTQVQSSVNAEVSVITPVIVNPEPVVVNPEPVMMNSEPVVVSIPSPTQSGEQPVVVVVPQEVNQEANAVPTAKSDERNSAGEKSFVLAWIQQARDSLKDLGLHLRDLLKAAKQMTEAVAESQASLEHLSSAVPALQSKIQTLSGMIGLKDSEAQAAQLAVEAQVLAVETMLKLDQMNKNYEKTFATSQTLNQSMSKTTDSLLQEAKLIQTLNEKLSEN